ncbi:MAG: NrfD/PsrC family molybdoenzyme membrane anchor subunit [Candidatus Limnocylindrales bacterium]|nr:NrfD/PsrC family molybdoenzyme membrane anchor subunit [Candidatus Limnocylindrales bacterium]
MPDRLALALERAWTGWRGERRNHGNVDHGFQLDLPVQKHWGGRVAFYLFLGGTGGGFVFLEIVLRWLGVLGTATAAWGMWIGLALAFLSLLAIFDHLGPVARWRFLYAFRRPRQSWISRGVMIVSVLVLLRLVVALPTVPGAEGLPWADGSILGDGLRLLVLGFALAFVIYSGLVISSWNAIAFWNSALVPVLFVGFSFLGGLAALPVIAWLADGLTAMEQVGDAIWPIVLALIAGDAIVLALYLHGMSTATRPARVSVGMILRGAERRRFVGGVVTLGLLIPAVVVTLETIGSLGTGTGAALLLVGAVAAVQAGGYFLRDTILRAGVYGPPV